MACVGKYRAKQVLLWLPIAKHHSSSLCTILLSSGNKPVSWIQLYMTTKQVSNDVHVHVPIQADHTHTVTPSYTTTPRVSSTHWKPTQLPLHNRVLVYVGWLPWQPGCWHADCRSWTSKNQETYTYFTLCLLPTQITAGWNVRQVSGCVWPRPWPPCTDERNTNKVLHTH